MERKEVKRRFDGEMVEVLGPTYEPGKPSQEGEGDWKARLTSYEAIIEYLKTAERYWYSKEWYGSEKRKNPA